MTNAEAIAIPNITPAQMQVLRDYMQSEDGSASPGNTGVAENECFAANFSYDESAKLLTLEPTRMVKSLTPTKLTSFLQQILGPPPAAVTLADGPTIYKPTPFSCATYNWVIGFITNNSGGVLTYSGQTTGNGTLEVQVSKIAIGDSPATHQDGYWRNKETKDSTTGCYGTVSYQLADGVTTLEIDYGANVSVAQANAALKGTNAARYNATCTVYTQYSGSKATEYTYPYVTLDKA